MGTYLPNRKTCFTLFLCLVTVIAWSQEDEWKLKKESDGVKVFIRKNEETKINDVRLQFQTEVPMERVIQVLRNPANFPNWVFNCRETKPLEVTEKGECFYYSRINFPWPMQDRDVVARSVLFEGLENGVVRIQSTAVAGRLPKTGKVVRIPYMDSQWLLSPMPDGTILLDYRLSSDPGGSLPAWLINMAVDKGPIETVKALRVELAAATLPSSSSPQVAAAGDQEKE